MLDHCSEKLLLQTFEGNSKIDNIDSNENFGKEVRVGGLSKHKDLELFVIINSFLSKFDHRLIVNNFDFFSENRIQNSRQSILDIKNQDRDSVFNGCLHLLLE